MTSPNQTAIPDLSSVLGLGAYQIGNTSNYGQNVTESFVRSLFTLPTLTFTNSLDVLVAALRKLPLDVLKLFEPLIPDAVEGAFEDVLTAVDTIVGLFVDRKPPVTWEEFEDWVSETFTTVQTEVKQIVDILGGLIVTPINAAVQAVKDWWDDLVSKTVNLTTQGLLDAAHLIGSIADSLIPGMSDLRVTAADAMAQATINADAIAALQTQLAQVATPAYVGNQNDMASVDRSSLWELVIDSSTGGHYHQYNGGSSGTLNTSSAYDTMVVDVPTFQPSSRSVYFVPIWADRRGLLRLFRFVVGGATGLFGLASYTVGLYSFTPTSALDGTLTQLWQSGNVQNAVKTSLLQEFSIDMGLGPSAVVVPGNLLFAAVYQDASGFLQGTRRIAAVPWGGIARSSQILLPNGTTTASDVLLKAPMYALNSQSALPSTATLSNLSQVQTALPWFAVSVQSP